MQSNSMENNIRIAKIITLYAYWTHFALNHEVDLYIAILSLLSSDDLLQFLPASACASNIKSQ